MSNNESQGIAFTFRFRLQDADDICARREINWNRN
jgi:hypothetical protein